MPDSQLAAATPSATRCHDCGTDVSRWWVDIDGAGLTTVCVSCAHASHIAAHYPCPHGQMRRYVSRMETEDRRKAVTTVVAAAFDLGHLTTKFDDEVYDRAGALCLGREDPLTGGLIDAGLFALPDDDGRSWQWWVQTAGLHCESSDCALCPHLRPDR